MTVLTRFCRGVGTLGLLGAVTMLASGCSGDDPAPLVAVVGASPELLVVDDDARDDLTLLLDYQDADGDLGSGIAEVHDCRAEGVVVTLRLPSIASSEAVSEGVPIAGTLELIVADVGAVRADTVLPSACSDLEVPSFADDQTVFCVYLTDAAGHTGPGDCTSPVTVSSTEE